MKKMEHQEVEIQITPMLDMAFQLLTFFIMTYNPAPAEGQFSMNLLPAAPVSNLDAPANPNAAANPDVPANLRTLPTNLYATPDGLLGRVTIEENEITGDTEADVMNNLRAKLQEITAANASTYEQTVIYADPALKYEELMKVVDIFSGLKIHKISFAELSASAAAGAGL